MLEYSLDIKGKSNKIDKYWEMCVGSCHAATALREDYRRLLRRCREEIGFRYVRFHGLFDDDMSVVSRPMLGGELTLSFTNIDNIFDFLISIGMKPFVELGFMPQALAGGDTTVFHYKGNTSPPKSYSLWGWFIEEFINHLIDRYGRGQVRSWFFEVWNEPNLGGEGSPYGFWSGSRQEYFKLYSVTARAIKRIDPCLKVGGPATSNNAWIPEFIDFCEKDGAPLDFISTHHYPTDSVLGYGVEDSANLVNPLPLDDKERLAEVMKMAQEGGEEFEKFKEEYSVFKSRLWESVDRGVLTQMARRAKDESKRLPLYYTEWGSLAGLESDGSFGASFIVKTVLDNIGLVQGYSFWTFSDIMEESPQNSNELHGGFGLLTQHGIPKAPYNAFRLLHLVQGDMYERVYRGETVDIYAFKSCDLSMVSLVAVNHNSLLHPIKEEEIAVTLPGVGQVRDAEIFRIDADHANPLEVDGRKYANRPLEKREIDYLKSQAHLVGERLEFDSQKENCKLSFSLLPMGTALINIYLDKLEAEEQ